jgi:hypothetical protein
MPVEPIPCAPGGSGTPGECACSPSIASTPLCRADGTTILVVVRSGCVDCGATPADPAVVGWVDPATGGFTAGAVPADAGPCAVGCSCSPSIATTPLCRADGTSVLLVVRSDCADCDTPAPDPEVVGWIDPLTGVFTPGAAPADVGPCAPGCVETICRTLCDDTDGDGAPDATYSELWCIRADGSATLLLTYQDDPSTPYTPVAPVDCTYGCPETETLQLCDDSGPFLRRYTWLNGVASFEDFALDGHTPHLVTGTVGQCPTESPCEAQTTPAATLGLCLADGTPIAVLVTRDCSGTVTQDGWINLTTGTYSTGAPPPSAQACGDSRAFELAGLLCDVDPATGDVLGLVLVEYEYNPDGSLGTVRLVDPATGNTYTLQGELRRCPAGTAEAAADLDLTVLCDVQADGTATPFLRDYRRDPITGQINGHTNYALDGTPYTPTGTVDTCTPEAAPCGDTEVLALCDVQPDGTAKPFLRHLTYDCDGAVTSSTDTALDGSTPYATTGTVGQCPPCPVAFSTECTALVENEWSYDNTGGFNGEASNCGSVQGPGPANGRPSFGCGGSFEVTSWIVDGVELVTSPVPFAGGTCGDTSGTGMHDHWAQVLTQLDPSATWQSAVNASCGWYVQTLDALDDTVYGTMVVRDAVTPSRVWTLGPNHTEAETLFTKVFTQECDGSVSVSWLDAQGVATTAPVGDLRPCGGDTETSVFHGEFQLCDVQADGTPVPFIRKFIQSPAGQVITVLDLDLDGTPYTPTGVVGVCSPAAEPCRNASTLLLCDVPTDGTPAPTVTDTPGAPYYPYTTGVATPGAQALWDGGTLNLPAAAGPQPGTGGTVRTAAAIIQAPRPVCDAGTARVSVQVDVTQLGPDNGCRATGFLALYNGTGESNRIGLALTPPDTPAGWAGTLTVEADVPADDLPAGNIAVALAFDAYDDSGSTCPPPRHTGWQLDEFAATVVYDQTGCATQYLSTVTTDCETGAVLSVTNTTLDGAPYNLTGEPGQCTPASGGTVVEPCGDTEVAQLCDLTYDPQAPIPTPASDFTLTGNVVAANNGTTLWFAQANQAANGVAELLVSGLLPAVRYEFRFASAWIGAGAPNPANNNAIYRLDILDGATPLATRTRNVSNGSNVFPGGVLTEDLPPLAFIAPSTGAVTIRFTDQTTGGPVNDRDLFLMPLEVRTEALTVKRTPFLRRLTFDCDGIFTSTQDLGLDGITPYVAQGDVGTCSADGGTAEAITPCDVQSVLETCRCDDADGDGVPEVGYVELLGVDCTGTITSLGTYTSDLTGPYTPVAPMDCDTGEEEGAEPAFGVQVRRVELAAGASWSATAAPTLQSVTAVAHGGTGTVTTVDGASTLHTGEAATWSVARDTDALLTGPLTIRADTGTVTVTWTQGVAL